jgi:DNA-binding MarR family transcriptional regulator
MVASNSTQLKLDALAQQLFEVATRFSLAVPRSRRRNGDLKDIEYLTLSILQHREPLIVGDLQRQLGILPAQMSRIIRGLETRDRPLIVCRINSLDKRKIDVALTAAGRAAVQAYQAARIRALIDVLAGLSVDVLVDIQELLNRLEIALANRNC